MKKTNAPVSGQSRMIGACLGCAGHCRRGICVRLLSILLMISPSAFPHRTVKIIIRVLNGYTGNPIAKVDVKVLLDWPNGEAFYGLTDQSGRAVLSLPVPLPPQLYVYTTSPELDECTPFRFNTAHIMDAGTISPDYCDYRASVAPRMTAISGELVIFRMPWCCLHWGTDAPRLHILLLDGHNGRPMPHQPVSIFYSSHFGKSNSDRKTDENGAIDIIAPLPVPTHIALVTDLPACSQKWFPMDEILAGGVVARDSCRRKGNWKVPNPRPGQIVLFARHETFLEKMDIY